MRNQPTNVVSSDPDYLLGWKNGQQVLVPKGGDQPAPWLLCQFGVPVWIPSNGTIDAAGNVTLTQAMHTIYNAGIWLHLPAGAVVGDATGGLYWVVMSSTTAGVVYGPKADLSGEFVPRLPSVLSTVVGSGSAYTQLTSEITLARCVLPGGSMGPNGALMTLTLMRHFNSANNKIYNTKLGGTNIHAATMTTSAVFQNMQFLRNLGVQNRQRTGVFVGMGVSNSAPTSVIDPTIDTSIAQVLSLSGSVANAAEFVVFEGFTAQVFPS